MTEKDTNFETNTLLAEMSEIEAKRENTIKSLLKQREDAEKNHELLLKSIATGLKALGYHKPRAKKAASEKVAAK